MALSGCGGGRPEGSTAVPAADALETTQGLTEITFWHSMDATNGIALQKLVDQFNAEHAGRIHVTAVFQGTYDDAITKYKASVQSDTTPSLVQVYDIGTQFMIDSGQVVPIADFAERDGYDLDQIQPNIAGYYSVARRQWSMPLNSSVPLLYYNKDAFRAAGLDPDDPPGNLAEIRAAAERLSASRGGPVQYGFGAAIYGWLLEQFASTSQQLWCDAENGRNGERVTQALLDQPTVVETVGWWQQMTADGLAVNTGRVTKDAQDAFKAGQTAITLESTGALKSFATAAEGKFELGVAPYPVVSGELAPGAGPSIGGASLWISGLGHTEAEKEASWQLVQFLASPESQAQWHIETGYFPINTAALELPQEKEYLAANPSFTVAIESLRRTELSPTSTGCAAGSMPQIRKASEDGLERALIGGDPQESMTKARQNVGLTIENYNQAVQ
nr:ABC transporter substrate-binding protein [Auraticoccus cholistanensis]